jgi:hypothetical protein
MRRREAEIRQQVEDEEKETEAPSTATTNGLFAVQRPGIHQNYGDLSALGRQLYGKRIMETTEEDTEEKDSPIDDDDEGGDFPVNHYSDDDGDNTEADAPGPSQRKRVKYPSAGACGVVPCLCSSVPACLICDGKECENTVHRHCAANKKTCYQLHTGDLGDDNERVFCSDACKRSCKGSRQKKPSTASGATGGTTTTSRIRNKKKARKNPGSNHKLLQSAREEDEQSTDSGGSRL